VTLNLSGRQVTPQAVAELKRILTQHQGNRLVRMSVAGPTKTTVYELPDYRVEPTTAFASEIKALLGSGALV
jgi:DNA polymerase-3 subunit alpha